MSNSHEWQFDNAWQEMLNHATLKVSLHFCHVSPNVTAFCGRNTHFGREQSLHECVVKFPFANDDIAMLPTLHDTLRCPSATLARQQMQKRELKMRKR